jgi:hypothetical protein
MADTMTRWDPFQQLARLRQDVDAMFGRASSTAAIIARHMGGTAGDGRHDRSGRRGAAGRASRAARRRGGAADTQRVVDEEARRRRPDRRGRPRSVRQL